MGKRWSLENCSTRQRIFLVNQGEIFLSSKFCESWMIFFFKNQLVTASGSGEDFETFVSKRGLENTSQPGNTSRACVE